MDISNLERILSPPLTEGCDDNAANDLLQLLIFDRVYLFTALGMFTRLAR